MSTNKYILNAAIDKINSIGVVNAKYLRDGIRSTENLYGAYDGAAPGEINLIASGLAPAKNTRRPVPPITVTVDQGEVHLSDGRHRMIVAKELGAKTISSIVKTYDQDGNVLKCPAILSINGNVKMSQLHQMCDTFEKLAGANQWYHGSPYSGLKSISDFHGKIMFLTDSLNVAKQYTKKLLASGRNDFNFEEKPTVYKIKLKFGSKNIFDTRVPKHLELFYKLSKISLQQDSEGGFRKSDLESGLPQFSTVRQLLPLIKAEGFVASYISEGSQGVSLAVVDPQHNLELAGEVSEIATMATRYDSLTKQSSPPDRTQQKAIEDFNSVIKRAAGLMPSKIQAEKIFNHIKQVRAANRWENDLWLREAEKIKLQLEYFEEKFPTIQKLTGVKDTVIPTLKKNLSVLIDGKDFTPYQQYTFVGYGEQRPIEIDEVDAGTGPKDLGF